MRSVLADFDFDAVHRFMESVGWEYEKDGERYIPSIIQLYQKAEDLLTLAIGNKQTYSSGGFCAFANDMDCELSFCIEESCCAFEDEFDDKMEEKL